MVQREIDLLEVRMVGVVAISVHWIHWTVIVRVPSLLRLFQIRQHVKRLRQLFTVGHGCVVGKALGLRGVTELIYGERWDGPWLLEVHEQFRHGRSSKDMIALAREADQCARPLE